MLVVGAIWVQEAPLIGSRPTAVSSLDYQRGVAEDVDARLWQDPFLAVHRYRKQHPGAAADDAHRMAYLLERAPTKGTLAVLAVAVSGAPFVGAEEFRRRQRYAVLSALSVEGFVPDDSEHIGFTSLAPDSKALRKYHLPEFIPFEWLSRDRSAGPPEKVLLLWIDEDILWTDFPLQQLLALFQQLDPNLTAEKTGERSIAWKVLGPASSGILRAMMQELAALPANAGELRGLSHIEFLSASATASETSVTEGTVGKNLTCEDEARRAPVLADDKSSDLFKRCGVSLRRVIFTDDVLAKNLREELQLRRAWPSAEHMKEIAAVAADFGLESPELKEAIAKLPRIVLISEWDTLYGRQFPVIMREQLFDSLRDLKDKDGQPLNLARKICPMFEAGAKDAPAAPCPIRYFSYMRGLDGQLPGQSSYSENDKSDKKDKKRAEEAIERPVGDGQLDYLRRLADRVARNQTAPGPAGGKVTAVGVLGTDVYDKLLVLQSMRNRLPEAVFFTTDLDAELNHPGEFRVATHNLVIASGFWLTLTPALQGHVPPFRDSYQTAVFLAARLAVASDGPLDTKVTQAVARWTGLPTVSPAELPPESPRLYEVGRTGFVDLSFTDGQAGPCAFLECPSVHVKRRVPTILGREVVLAAIAGTALFGLLWLAFKQVRRAVASGWRAVRRRPLLPLVAVSALGVAVWFVWQDVRDLKGEPWALIDGVSIWPTEVLRLVALVLSLTLLVGGWRRLRRNGLELTHRYFRPGGKVLAGRRSYRRWTWRTVRAYARGVLSGAFCRWTRTQYLRPNADSAAIWQSYLHPQRLRPRLARLVLPVFLYWLLSVTLFLIFGFPVKPSRGDFAWWFDQVLLQTGIIAFLLLLFFVIDETRRCSALVKRLSVTNRWPVATLERFGQVPGLEQMYPNNAALARYMDDWIDIDLIACRTETVGRLIYAPFIVLTVMIVARMSVFDNWSLPPLLAVIITVSVLLAIGCAFNLRFAAERARSIALENLQHKALLADGRADTALSGQIQTLISRIEGMRRGAFCPFTQQPWIKAVLIPFGSVSGIAILDYLAATSF